MNDTYNILMAVGDERIAQEVKFPDQHCPSGTSVFYSSHRELYRALCDEADREGKLTWLDVLREEFYEAASEEDPAKLKAELIQVAAVCVRWIEDLDA